MYIYILVKNTSFDNNFVNFRLNVTKFGMLIDNIGIDMSHDFGYYGNHFGRNKNSLVTKMCVFINWVDTASIH